MFLNQIREYTHVYHEALERDADILAQLRTFPAYRKLLQSYYGYFAPLELLLTGNTAKPDRLITGDTCRTQFLRDDLAALGDSQDAIDTLDRCAKLPIVNSPAAAIGCRYVIEGSALGGRVICRAVAAQLGLTPETGTRFFFGWGDDTGRRWRDFGLALESFAASASPPEQDQMLSAARATFTTFHDWLKICRGKQSGG